MQALIRVQTTAVHTLWKMGNFPNFPHIFLLSWVSSSSWTWAWNFMANRDWMQPARARNCVRRFVSVAAFSLELGWSSVWTRIMPCYGRSLVICQQSPSFKFSFVFFNPISSVNLIFPWLSVDEFGSNLEFTSFKLNNHYIKWYND